MAAIDRCRTAQMFSVLALLACGSASQPAETPASDPQPHAPGTAEPSGDVRSTPAGDPIADDAHGTSKASPAAAPLDPQPLEGPFASLEDYLEANPAPHDDSCGPRPGPSVRPHRVGAAGRFREARLMRAPGSIACAHVEYCIVGLRTAEGWFVRASSEACHGTLGPGQDVATLAPKTRWIGSGTDQVLAIETTRRTKTLEIREQRGVRDERVQDRESRYLTLCGLGASAKPSCTPPVVLSCPDTKGNTSQASWSWAADQVTFESEADPLGACEWDGPFVVGTFAIRFP
jgi:hypothetical protein